MGHLRLAAEAICILNHAEEEPSGPWTLLNDIKSEMYTIEEGTDVRNLPYIRFIEQKYPLSHHLT